jgi:hypothetical protein
LEVLSSEFVVKISQIQWFLENTPFFGDMESYVCSRLIPALSHDSDADHICRAIEGVRSSSCRDKLKQDIRRLIYFNPQVMTDHYVLSLDNPAERAVAERLCSINLWESRRAEALGEFDRSMYGNYDQIRNFSYKRGAVEEDFDYKSVAVVFPLFGEVVIDYVASKRSQGGAPMNALAFVQLCETLKGVNIRARARVLAVRAIADRLCLSAEQVMDLANALVQKFVQRTTKVAGARGHFVGENALNHPSMAAAFQQAMGADGGAGEAFSPNADFVTTGETVRTHVVLCMLSQCLDVHNLFSCDERGGAFAILGMEEQQFMVHILGPLVAFDPVNLHEGESNCSNVFEVDLAKYQGQTILKFLLEVIAHEKVMNLEHHKELLAQDPDTPAYKDPITDVEWSPVEEEDGSVLRPEFDAAQFLSKPPDKGVLSFCYEKGYVFDVEKRKELARKKLGWIG